MLQALGNEMLIICIKAGTLYYLLCKCSNYIHQHFSPCRNRNDLAEVVALLKTQIDPELLKREEQKQQTKPDSEEEKENAEENKGYTF